MQYFSKKFNDYVKLRTLCSPLSALRFIIPRKIFLLHSRYGRLTWKNIPFLCRDNDLTAVDEVLFREEYQVLSDIFSQSEPQYIIDAGGHIGLFAIYAFSLFPKATIYSFEASPSTYKILEHNRSLSPNVNWQIMNVALSNKDACVEFVENEMTMGSKMASVSNVPPAKTVTVKSLSFPSMMRDITPRIDLLKCDIEGAEELFLCSHEHLLGQINHCLIEIHPGLCDTAKVESILRGAYKFIYRVGDRVSSKPVLLTSQTPLPGLKPYN